LARPKRQGGRDTLGLGRPEPGRKPEAPAGRVGLQVSRLTAYSVLRKPGCALVGCDVRPCRNQRSGGFVGQGELLSSHAPLREAVLEFYEALVVPLVGNGVAAWRGGCPNVACAG
jgi:hypothetical protein